MNKSLGSAFIWSAAQTVVRLAVGFLSIKVTAVYLGPTGLALTAQINNVFSLLQSTLSNAVENGVIKLTAKGAGTDVEVLRRVVSTASRFLIVIGVVVAVVAVLLSSLLAQHLLGDAVWAPVFVLLGLTFPLMLFGQLILSVHTGLRRFDLVSLTHVGITVLGSGLFVGLSVLWGLTGGLIGSVLAYSVVLVVSAGLAYRTKTLRRRDFGGPWNHDDARAILYFYPMLLARGAAWPLGMLFVRSMMLEGLGPNSTGLWQAAVRLSDMYTLVITTALSMYSMPTLSAAKTEAVLRREMTGLIVKIGVTMAMITLTLFALRHWIVRIVFTTGFESVGDIWRFQLLGDILELVCVPLRQALMVRERAGAYIAVEGLGAIAFAGGAYLLVQEQGVEAAPMARALAWGLTIAALLWLNRRILFSEEPALHTDNGGKNKDHHRR